MNRDVHLMFAPQDYAAVHQHLYRGDRREHAGVLLCGWAKAEGRILLTVREFVPAVDGVDYVQSPRGHGRLQPLFIDDILSRAKELGLAYVAIHNHFSGNAVAFSKVDLASHEYGYPTLAKLNAGLPVGAAVFGTNSVEVDLWMPSGKRHQLRTARIVGSRVHHLWATPALAPKQPYDEQFDRQLPFLRAQGQGLTAITTIGIVGLGGLGSQLLEPLIRLGFRRFILIDPDRLDRSNYSRVHGARPNDLPNGFRRKGRHKVDIAERLLKQIAPDVEVLSLPHDVAHGNVHQHLLACDFVFLAADTAPARLTCNALSQQYFVPMLQVGTKVHFNQAQALVGVFGAIRHIGPGQGCLWCNGLIDRVALADACKTEEQRKKEHYGVKTPNPSVVTFNAEVAGRALNRFICIYLTSGTNTPDAPRYELLDLLSGEREAIEPTREEECPFCSTASGSLFGLAGAAKTPVVSG